MSILSDEARGEWYAILNATAPEPSTIDTETLVIVAQMTERLYEQLSQQTASVYNALCWCRRRIEERKVEEATP